MSPCIARCLGFSDERRCSVPITFLTIRLGIATIEGQKYAMGIGKCTRVHFDADRTF
jgi:hypothetical protein